MKDNYINKWFLNLFLVLFVLLIIWLVWKIIEKQLEIKKYKDIEKKAILIQKQIKKQQQLKYKNFLNNIDLFTDSSIYKFVNNKVHFNKLDYVPENLVEVSAKHIIDWKWWYIKVRKILKEHLEEMAEQFYKDTKNNIVVVSWYRSYRYQKWIKDRGCPDNLCAKAGYSEHQSWLAVDLYSASSEKNWKTNNNLKKYYFWLQKNAYKYWFHNTYQKWIKVDGYEIEPWHWRYLWYKLAKYLHDNNMTFAEFYNQKNLKKN